ncbi:cytochrome P450 [Nocardia sp. NPDC051570]|uniref:cytochrome P450 n=1 Tax=Nocardia sp. NPDC051570 TaxID=3364324 RepID=UPI0037BB7CDE
MASRIPTAPGALPLLGHALPLLRRPLAFFTTLPAHGDLVQIRLGPAQAVVICDPGLTEQVLRDDRTFDKGGPMYDRLREVVGGDGIGGCPHSEHRRQRRLAAPAFHHQRLPDYAQIMMTRFEAAIDSWRDGQILDILPELTTISTNILAAAMFSDTLPPAMMRQALDDLALVLAGAYRRMLTPPPLNQLPTPGNLRYNRARSRLRHTIDGIVAERRTSGTQHDDLLSALVNARDPDSDDKHGLTDAEIADTAMTIFLAGGETAATTLAWALHLLAAHPDIEQRLHAEVDSVLGNRPAQFTDLPRLEFTKRVITESLRLWPPGWMATRITTSDTQLGDYTLPRDTTMLYSPYLIHHRGDLYDEPDRFDPDRWLPERASAQRGTYIAFGGGARRCIGDTFGTVETVLALAIIAARKRLRPVHSERVKATPSIVLFPSRLRMRVTTRGMS